jgi:hypothetical protein
MLWCSGQGVCDKVWASCLVAGGEVVAGECSLEQPVVLDLVQASVVEHCDQGAAVCDHGEVVQAVK